MNWVCTPAAVILMMYPPMRLATYKLVYVLSHTIGPGWLRKPPCTKTAMLPLANTRLMELLLVLATYRYPLRSITMPRG
jgi:hypothetical protein